MLSIYSFLTWLIQPFVRRKLLRRAIKEPLYGAHIEERFGTYKDLNKLSPNAVEVNNTGPLVWIHAVSLGEARAAAILLKELRAAIPAMRLLLTNGTATGRAEGEKLLQAGDIQVWQPWDTKAATHAFFAHFKPSMGVLMETEVWPNLIASANALQIPVALVNARMSEKSLKQSKRWYTHRLANHTYPGLAAVYAQTQDDAARLITLGVTVNGVFGNLKFDITPNGDQIDAGKALRSQINKPVILFASSREGEEAMFLMALQTLPKAQREAALWLVVPRHPQRFDEVAGLMEATGFAVLRRSKVEFTALALRPSILLGDSLGEMAFYYSFASAALLGGSFAKLGGQNLIEALACGCPVAMGPHTFNFEEAAQLAAAAGVAFRVDGLQSAIQSALQQTGFNRDLAANFVAEHRGAALKTAQAIASLSSPTAH